MSEHDGAEVVTANPWVALRQFTDARIALGRAGVSMPTQPQLAFQLAHAQARDAVHRPLDVEAVRADLRHWGLDVLLLHSAAADRHIYLQRPDLGRQLDLPSRQVLRDWPSAPKVAEHAASEHGEGAHRPFDVAFVVADGLSSRAVAQHARALLQMVVPVLQAERWRVAPLTLVEQGRVALADEVGLLLGARMSVILIGERPGLSSPDSMGVYLTWMPQIGLTDARRNCISNIRQSGLSYADAAQQLCDLMREARRQQISGVKLKT